MARPHVVRTKEQAAAVPLGKPIQVEIALPKTKPRTVWLSIPVAEDVVKTMETEAARRKIPNDKLLALIGCVVTKAVTRLRFKTV
jgi:predicted thioesterase